MSKADFLAQLDADRQRLLQAIEGLSDEEMTAASAVGEWSVQDILGHIAAWEWEVGAFPQLGNTSLRRLLDWHHDGEHAADLEAWRARL
ncbi:MAG: DinB family protein [Anaerolineae bacterium]|nr:DinB family protein [Anaerolineae bacterium]